MCEKGKPNCSMPIIHSQQIRRQIIRHKCDDTPQCSTGIATTQLSMMMVVIFCMFANRKSYIYVRIIPNLLCVRLFNICALIGSHRWCSLLKRTYCKAFLLVSWITSRTLQDIHYNHWGMPASLPCQLFHTTLASTLFMPQVNQMKCFLLLLLFQKMVTGILTILGYFNGIQ